MNELPCEVFEEISKITEDRIKKIQVGPKS
jgi:hypothetical protein